LKASIPSGNILLPKNEARHSTSFLDSGTNEDERGQEIQDNAQTVETPNPLEMPSPLETSRLLQDLELEPREQALPRIRTSRQALSDRKAPNGLDGYKGLGFKGKASERETERDLKEVLARDREESGETETRTENALRALTLEDPSSPAPRSLHVSSKLLTSLAPRSVWVEVEGLNTFGEHLITGLTANTSMTHSPSGRPFSIAAPRFWP